VVEHVDRTLESYMDSKQIGENWPVRERLAVCISSNPSAQYLIARGARMARRLDAEYFVIYVDAGADQGPDRQKSLAANIQFAESLGAKVVQTRGRSIADAVAKIVRVKRITQVIFGRSAVKGLHRLFYLSAVHRFLREAPAVDVHIVTHGEESSNAPD
jgi:two-component system sensor histidine kinase KdpD